MKTSLHLQSIYHKKINLNRYLTLLAVFFAFLIGNTLCAQNNTLVPFSVKVVGEETVMNIECYKVEIKHFEGEAMHWVEKASPHRLVRTEQPSQHRITELIQ